VDQVEEFKVKGDELLGRVRELIKEGNARHLTIQNSDGKTIVEIPLTIGVVGALIAPVAAAIGAIAALVTECTVTVTRDEESDEAGTE
jgi:ribosomal 30S subunit maturation factor RimM